MPASIGNVEIYAVKGDVEDEDYEEDESTVETA